MSTRKRDGRPGSRHHGDCAVCGKKRYGSRKDARAAARALYPGDHLSAYRCADAWHYGHLSAYVIARGATPRPSRAG